MINTKIRIPAFVMEEKLLVNNLRLLENVQKRAGIKIILALKAFAFYPSFPLIGKYLSGATASSLHEAMLINREMGCKAHSYCVAYREVEFRQMCAISEHLVFNSISQYTHFKPIIDQLENKPSFGIRVNPEYSSVKTALYNPAARGSRLGETSENMIGDLPEGIEGLHFHSLCESNSYDLERTLEKFEEKFGHLFSQIKWLNMGGGHLMTGDGYDLDHLVELLTLFRQRTHIQEIILEPGSAVVWGTGYLLTKVLDIHDSHGIKTIILDISFTAHLPDTLEMPYRPEIRGAYSDPEKGQYAYRIGGVSCLSGDYLSEYGFDYEVKVGDVLLFEDMIHYTTVKTTMFNGVHHPDLGIIDTNGNYTISKSFGYDDFRSRFGV